MLLTVKLHAIMLKPHKNTTNILISKCSVASFLRNLHIRVTCDLNVYTAQYTEKIPGLSRT